jgi:hypothetical protein
MRLISVLVLNKRGELQLAAHSHAHLKNESFSNFGQQLHNFLLDLFRVNRQIDVCYRVYGDVHCLINVNKESILVVVAYYQDRFLAYDLLRQLHEFI